MNVRARLLVGLAASVVAGCGGPMDPPPDAGIGRDASVDAALAEDAGSDAAASEAGTDAAPQPSDAAVDAGEPVDAGLDAPATDAGLDASAACPARPYVGLFVWNDDLADTRDEILDLAVAHDVTEIYLHANLFYAGSLAPGVLAAWIEAANARCIDVDLLFGNAAWMLPAMRTQATMRTAWAVDFAATHPDARPSGVHWDLEPQQLAAWDDPSMQPGLVSELVTTLQAMTPVAEAGGLPLTIDMGFFLDDLLVTRAGVTRPGSEWVTDSVSRVVLMDYRDSALSMGHGGMISLAQLEMTYASSVDVPMVIAAETTRQSPEYVSFFEEGYAAMVRELGVVRTTFAPERAFVGVAIHDRDGLAALAP